MFEVINGGLSEGSKTSRKKFIEAYITNTRLMGVVGIGVHWKLVDNSSKTEFFQCFYLDAEEYGFDSYEYVVGPDDEETRQKAEALADRLMGGLGGVRIKITEREAKALIQDYVYMNYKKGIEIPDEAEIDFIMKPQVRLKMAEREALMAKQCEEIIGDYQLVNYFIMRCIGHDFEAAKYLADGHISLAAFRDDEPATLMRNESELIESDMSAGTTGSFSTEKSYRCESLVEQKNYFEVITSRVTVKNLKVIGFELVSRDRISHIEAQMITRREEYIMLDEFDFDPAEFTKESSNYTRRSQETDYGTGRLFMIFNPDNHHVLERVYRLFDDVFGTIFVSNFGQILISSFRRENILSMERDIRLNIGQDLITPIAKYSFDMPVLYEFVQSNFEDFEDFIDAISTYTPDN